jgi:hypothetical protein
MIRQGLRLALLAGAMALAPLASAHADAFDDLATASDAELAAARGGFVTADGIAFDLGAVIRTYQNGELALMSQLTWTPNGAVVSHTSGDPYSGAAQAAQAAAARLAGGGGFAVADASGATAIAHDVAGANLRSLVITSASDTRFLQDIEVTITLPGFEAMQAGFMTDRLGLRLGAELSALLGTAGRY